MAKMTKAPAKTRSGPRAPEGKRPLTVLLSEVVIQEAKIAAIRERTNVSQITDKLLRGWLDGTYKLKI
ncbi:hypothetical protein ABIA99_003490 [Bradyrhizobium sp. LB12.1]|uniref:hypothetical protein n=1 Tax=Bradyrhizobium sp. LB12.1 TaxID=3156327 RepID=UPI003393373D